MGLTGTAPQARRCNGEPSRSVDAERHGAGPHGDNVQGVLSHLVELQSHGTMATGVTAADDQVTQLYFVPARGGNDARGLPNIGNANNRIMV